MRLNVSDNIRQNETRREHIVLQWNMWKYLSLLSNGAALKTRKKGFCRIAEGWKEQKHPSHIIQSHKYTTSCALCAVPNGGRTDRRASEWDRERKRVEPVSYTLTHRNNYAEKYQFERWRRIRSSGSNTKQEKKNKNSRIAAYVSYASERDGEWIMPPPISHCIQSQTIWRMTTKSATHAYGRFVRYPTL